MRNGQGILSFEERLHIAPERYLDNWLTHHHVLAYVSSDFYDNAIFGVTLGLAAWIWWRRPDIYRPLRNELVLANLIGFTVFWLYPVAPPRMLPGFTDIVEKVGGLGSWHNTLISHADQLAAMPSMHLAWAVWCSLVVWRLASRGMAPSRTDHRDRIPAEHRLGGHGDGQPLPDGRPGRYGHYGRGRRRRGAGPKGLRHLKAAAWPAAQR